MSSTQADPREAALLQRARSLFASGRTGAIRSLLNAARALGPGSAELRELEARLLLTEDRVVEAVAHLNDAIDKEPDAVALLLCRAEAYIRSGNVKGASADASQAVLLDRSNVKAKAILGIALIEAGQYADAATCLREAINAAPQCAAYSLAMAEALERLGDRAGADAVLAEAIDQVPDVVGLRTSRLMLALRGREFTVAVEHAEAAIRDGVVDASVLGLYGHALSSLGRGEEAAQAYAEALKLSPDDAYIGHLVRSAGILPQAERAPAAYLEAVFDGYAEHFENHLITLGYRVPGLVRQEVLRHAAIMGGSRDCGGRIGATLDLGCGTGLVGVALSDLEFECLVGVDASDGMLAKAQDKQLYAELVHGDIEQMLGADARSWKLVIAADVLCYFGAIQNLFEKIRLRLDPAGLFIFSVEELIPARPPGGGGDAEEWKLARLGRYAHSQAYVERALAEAGMRPIAVRRETLRLEGGEPVAGLLVTARPVRH
jgi:predicted TPR repeat methyltransferase/thioredoxin-like negative regulator of GroEL